LKALATTVVILMLLAGATLLGYARWTRGLEEADAALAAGRLEQAIAGYDQAEARFERTPAAKQLFRREYARASRNRLWALYQMKRYDDAIAAAERAPAEANPFFWSGCAFFIKAKVEEKPEARIGWI
jgi:tetratricopeptide (TPR) repeat protein